MFFTTFALLVCFTLSLAGDTAPLAPPVCQKDINGSESLWGLGLRCLLPFFNEHDHFLQDKAEEEGEGEGEEEVCLPDR